MPIEPGDTHCRAGHPQPKPAMEVVKMSFVEVNKHIKAYDTLAQEHPESQIANDQLGMCYIKLGQYDKALPFLEKATVDNWEDGDSWFMTAVCLLRGKKPFVATRADINKAVDCLKTANKIEPTAFNYLLLGYIKTDYFDRKYLNVSPSSEDEYAKAESLGATQEDFDQLMNLLFPSEE